MSKKNKSNSTGLVYSTDPDFKWKEEQAAEDTSPSGQQKLRIRLDKNQRAGKTVTLIQGFNGKEDDLDELGKKLRSFCGTGGSVKDGEIIIQGDQREKILQWLLKNDYRQSKKV
jgi:translation initiation factor 1